MFQFRWAFVVSNGTHVPLLYLLTCEKSLRRKPIHRFLAPRLGIIRAAVRMIHSLYVASKRRATITVIVRMTPNANGSSRRTPWISIVLGILAIVSLLFAPSDGGYGYYPLYGLSNLLIPILFLAGLTGFFVGMTRFLASHEQDAKNNGVHLMLWSLGGLILVAALWVSMQMRIGPVYQIMAPQMAARESAASAPRSRDMMAPYPYPKPSVPVTDTREFLKQDYHATIRTRHVEEITRRAETTVRGFGGRVDQTSSSPRSGYIAFVVPADKFDEFRAEIESFVDPRFLSVNITSENLLPQKQSIEEQQKNAEARLAELRAERKQVVAAHTAAVASLQGDLDANAREETMLRAEVTSDAYRRAQIANRLNELAREKASLESRMASENATYASKLNSLDAQISYENSNLSSIKKQDKDLLDTVATVTGTISIQWITLWEIAHLYLPGYWIPFILAILAVLSFVYERHRWVI